MSGHAATGKKMAVVAPPAVIDKPEQVEQTAMWGATS